MARSKEQGRKRKSDQKDDKETSQNEGTEPKQQKQQPEGRKWNQRFRTTSDISSNAKGFLIFFGDHVPWKEMGEYYMGILSNALELLNEYADKVYPTDVKSYHFEHKLAKKPGKCPIFIETDIEDPSILLNAIITDLEAPSFDVEKVKNWSSFLPVNRTCHQQPDDIIQSVKDVLDPLFEEQDCAKVLRVDVNYSQLRVNESDKVGIKKEIDAYLISKRAEIKPTTGAPESYTFVTVQLRVFKEICCVCLIKSYKNYKKSYSVTDLLKKRSQKEILKKLTGVTKESPSEGAAKNIDTDKTDTIESLSEGAVKNIDTDKTDTNESLSEGAVKNIDTDKTDTNESLSEGTVKNIDMDKTDTNE